MKPDFNPTYLPEPIPTGNRIAEVLEAVDGEALSVLMGYPAHETLITAHASEVPPLKAGDRVIILLTDMGAMVTHQLRMPGQRPQRSFNVNCDGSLSVHTTDGITLATDHATIELRADGRILVDGKEIYAIADGLQRLQGASIELN